MFKSLLADIGIGFAKIVALLSLASFNQWITAAVGVATLIHIAIKIRKDTRK